MGPAAQGRLFFEDDHFTSSRKIASVQPQHIVRLGTYYIGKYPVTNREYKKFVKSVGYKYPSTWKKEDVILKEKTITLLSVFLGKMQRDIVIG